MKLQLLKRFNPSSLCNATTCDTILSKRATKLRDRSWQIRLLIVLVASLVGTSNATWAESGDLAVSSPHLIAINPCFSTRSTGIRLVDGTAEPALEMVCGGVLTWDIPQGASSFHVTLWRAESVNAFATSQPAPTGPDSIRVLISLDGKPAADTVLRKPDPAEKWLIPINHAHTVSIKMEQEYGAFGLYLGDPGFSAQTVAAASVQHVLAPGQGYANLGAGVRQSAFLDFHPGEKVPIQVEYAGNAARADVELRISLLTGTGARTIPVDVALQTNGARSVGYSQWQVPPFYGPADVELDVSIASSKIYSVSFQVALAKEPDVSVESEDSTFGIHESTSGSLTLEDDEASLWGVKWARFFIAWPVVEAKEGEYDWHWIDNVVESYSDQHLALMGVMGELPPKWITDPATQVRPAYAKFVQAALEHFKGKIHVWGVYNEIDSKFYTDRGFNRELEPTGDIEILKQELEQMQQFDPSLVKICCAAGISDFLPYEKRLFSAGLIGMTDGVEFHPFQAGPPEEGDYGMNYVQMAGSLAMLATQYGPAKQVWATESNWLFGPEKTHGVSAPQVTEHEQSQYLVRCSLLSLAMRVPYFIHSPFFFPWHRNVLVDSLASYSQLTSLFAVAQKRSFLELPPHHFGVTASTPAGTVVALWTDSLKPASVRVTGLGNMTIQDMYGNPLPASEIVQLTGSPVYLIGQGVPSITPVEAAMPVRRLLPPPTAWKVMPSAQAQRLGNGKVHITSSPTKYDSQLKSDILNVSPNGCYILVPSLVLHQGGVNVEVVDPDSNQVLRNEYIYAVNGNEQYNPEIRVKTGNSSHMQVILTASNPHDPEVSDFEVGNVTMSDCP